MFGTKINSLSPKNNLPDRPNLSSIYDRERSSIGSEIFYNRNKIFGGNKKNYRNRTSSLFSVAAAALYFNSACKPEKRYNLKQKIQVKFYL